MLASLKHPNVAVIYGFVEGRNEDVPVYALALELVEGPAPPDPAEAHGVEGIGARIDSRH